MAEAELRFPPHYIEQGFSNGALSRYDGHAEPVVRELIQNGMDAAVDAGRRRAEIVFTIDSVLADEIPGIAQYKAAFDSAVSDRDTKLLSHDAITAMSRIDETLQRAQVPVLYCRDNGCGLDVSGIRRLIGEGNSDKGHNGVGTFGVGHLTFFSASNLRYVLYTGRTVNGRRRNVVAGGHAILATHGQGGELRSHDGIWCLGLANGGKFPCRAPSMMHTQLRAIDGSGAVVAICGFNDFGSMGGIDPVRTVKEIARVAAKNFLAAIWADRMSVEVVDKRPGGAREIVDRESLPRILSEIAGQKRFRGTNAVLGNRITGFQAHNALLTLRQNVVLDAGGGRRVFFRNLLDDEGSRPKVNVFRDGMWITNAAPNLATSDFIGCNRFDAVITVDKGDQDGFWRSVRDAEGPEHRGIEPRRLNDQRRAMKLLQSLKDVGHLLRESAGAPGNDDVWVNEQFAVFDRAELRNAYAIPRYKPRRPGIEVEREPAVEAYEEPNSQLSKVPSTAIESASPNPGTPFDPPASVVGNNIVGGRASGIRVMLLVEGASEELPQQLGIRVRVESGSDESCELPIRPEWAKLKWIAVGTYRYLPTPNRAFEVLMPAESGEFRVEFVDAQPVGALALDIVRRAESPNTNRAG